MRETIDLILYTVLLRNPSLHLGSRLWPHGWDLFLSTPCLLSGIKGNPVTFYVEQLISCSALVFQFCFFSPDLVLEALSFHPQMAQ